MKKSILNLGKALNKTQQQKINGGSIDGCSSSCYGISNMGCNSCQEYFLLSTHCQMRVKVGVNCFSN